MSRTYRRTAEKTPDYVLREYSWHRAYRLRVTLIDEKSKKGKALIAEYHSDKARTMQQVPKWYKVQFCRRPFRRKEKVAIIQAVKYIEEDISFPKPVKDAMYYW